MSFPFILARLLGILSIVTCTAQRAIPTNGLVLYYPFNGNTEDVSGQGNHAVVHNASLAPDRFGAPDSALVLVTEGAFLETQHPLPESPSITVSLWIELASWFNPFDKFSPQVIFFERNGDMGQDLSCIAAGGIHFARGTNSLSYRNWLPPRHTSVNLVCVADAENRIMSIYVDGVRCRTAEYTPGSTSTNRSNFNLGRRPGIPGDWFALAGLDNVRVYNRALTRHEIATLYLAEAGTRRPLQIEVESVRLKLDLNPGHFYLLQVSSDLITWENALPFQAVQEEYDVKISTENGERFFRLWEQ